MKETIIIAIVSSGAFSALISAILAVIIKKIERKNEVKDSIALGLTVLLEDRINYVATEYIKKGWAYQDDIDRLERMWNIYHNVLGGNGYLDGVMGMLRKLPRKIRGITMEKEEESK